MSDASTLISPAAAARPVPGRFPGLRYGLAALAGLVWALAQPLPGWSGLAWVAPGLLLAVTLDQPRGQAFRLGFVAGLVHHLVALRWLLHIPFPSGAVAAWLSLSGYCGLFPGLWALLAGAFIRRLTCVPAGAGWREAVRGLTGLGWAPRATVWLWVAALWVGFELFRGRFLSGFSWGYLGVTQWRNAPLLQVASLTGVYGVSFLVVWISAALTGAVLRVAVRPERRFGWSADLRVPILVLLLTVGLGFQRLMRPAPPADVVSLGLVQPSIPQTLIWDDAANPERFAKVFQLTRQALAAAPQVLVWPEGSMPDLADEQFATVAGELRRTGTAWIFGTGYGKLVNGRPEHYNAALLVSPAGRVADTYHKRRLVIFGEFIPFEDTLPFMKWLTPIGSGFTPGRAPGNFRVGPATNINVSPMICFEDVFPESTREHVTPETDFLLELTNNGWFGESSAQWQHCANAAFRAVENGVPLVRCSNNGLTCWIDQFGRMRDLFGQADGNVYGAGVLFTTVPLRTAGTVRPLTPYHRVGDVFAWTCLALAVVGVLPVLRAERSRA